MFVVFALRYLAFKVYSSITTVIFIITKRTGCSQNSDSVVGTLEFVRLIS